MGIVFLVIAVIVHLVFKALRGTPQGRATVVKQNGARASYGSSDEDVDGEAIACWRDRYFGAVICVQIFVTVILLLGYFGVVQQANNPASGKPAGFLVLLYCLILIPVGLFALVSWFGFLYSKWRVVGIILAIVLLPLLVIPYLNILVFGLLLLLTRNDGQPRISSMTALVIILVTFCIQTVTSMQINMKNNPQQESRQLDNDRPLFTNENREQSPSSNDTQAQATNNSSRNTPLPNPDRESTRNAMNSANQKAQDLLNRRSNMGGSSGNSSAAASGTASASAPSTPAPLVRYFMTDFPQLQPMIDSMGELEIAQLPSRLQESAVKFDRNGNGYLVQSRTEFEAFARKNIKELEKGREEFHENVRLEQERQSQPGFLAQNENSITPDSGTSTTASTTAESPKKKRTYVQPDFIMISDLFGTDIPQDMLDRAHNADTDKDGRLSHEERLHGYLLDIVQYLPQAEFEEEEDEVEEIKEVDVVKEEEKVEEVASDTPPSTENNATDQISSDTSARRPLFDRQDRLILAELNSRENSRIFYDRFEKADANHDGLVDKEELKSDSFTKHLSGISERTDDHYVDLSVIRNQYPPSPFAEKYLQGDSDNDGFLSPEDARAALRN